MCSVIGQLLYLVVICNYVFQPLESVQHCRELLQSVKREYYVSELRAALKLFWRVC